MEALATRRNRFIAEAKPGADAARQLCMMTDEAVAALAVAASSRFRGRWSVLALGGWGAGALLPASDLDILFLTDGKDDAQPFVQAVLYPLWDAGLKVGHQVRTKREQVQAMRLDDKSLTATLTARPIAGDSAWATQAIGECIAAAASNRKRLLQRLSRRERPGSPYALEPDLKNGRGGRRDFDEVTWTAAAVTRAAANGFESLVEAGLLGGDERLALESAAAVVSAARWSLQLEGYGDRMSAESLDPEMQQCVQNAVVSTSLIVDDLRLRAGGKRAPGSDRATPASVFELLDRGEPGVEPLERAAAAGMLDHLVNGMSDLMRLRRPGLGHDLTVGAHCVRAASHVSELSRRVPGSPTRQEVRLEQVAALVHDVGKVDGGRDHAAAGVGPAESAARNFGLSETDAQAIGALVRNHLLLVETALRRDLDDEDVILSCASRIGHEGLIRPLHVLTAADSLATGRGLWSPWLESLVTTLASRLEAAFSPAIDGAGLAQRAAEIRDVVTAQANGSSAVADFLGAAPLRYLATHEPEEVIRHAELVADLKASPTIGAVLAVSPGPAEQTHRVTIATTDAPHLLARLAGAVALAGLDILAVDAYRGPGNIALDGFTVKSATGRPVSTETFALLERLVRAALRDRLYLQARLAERRNHYPPRADVPVEVSVEQSGWDTRLLVSAPDRPGLLYDIARVVAAQGMNIRWARAQTVEGVARDVFHIVGPDGGRVDDSGVLGHLSMGIREAI